jgi:uncharacterized protein (DUF2164 family)
MSYYEYETHSIVGRIERQLNEVQDENQKILRQQGELKDAFAAIAERLEQVQEALDALVNPKLDKKTAASLGGSAP